jgi:hypothetical protein
LYTSSLNSESTKRVLLGSLEGISNWWSIDTVMRSSAYQSLLVRVPFLGLWLGNRSRTGASMINFTSCTHAAAAQRAGCLSLCVAVAGVAVRAWLVSELTFLICSPYLWRIRPHPPSHLHRSLSHNTVAGVSCHMTLPALCGDVRAAVYRIIYIVIVHRSVAMLDAHPYQPYPLSRPVCGLLEGHFENAQTCQDRL